MEESTSAPEANQIDWVSNLVAAYVSNNSVQASDLPELITSVHAALRSLDRPAGAAEGLVEKLTPAQIRKSITRDALISFIDGKPYKSLKRHLTTRGLDPHSYRQQYGLPADYPMTAASYSEQRSALAKETGLGRRHQKVDPTPTPVASKKPKGNRSSRKTAGAETGE
ncbi:putative transcriptional regulator [Methylobacterium sp. BE186]|uniref:MucR family transcriptional regulator n=1 Tax=Methylobacterium sp. BE186 TaxID=2817715 RepID=UPI002861E0B9|nr:MucR family transcriptional regulator [Methylobacterium sp. BE186]MDR7040618.1 putative transcriptional regulator [Methylobacterium sp. BE186]